MKLLLLSNSTNPGEPYLSYPLENIKSFLGNIKDEIVFIPYAAVTFSYDEYEQKVNNALQKINVKVKSIHHFPNPAEAIAQAKAIFIGGGNTWKLRRTLHDNELIKTIRQKVKEGIPYVGWSAGSNVACPTIMTTNDMPIIDPLGMGALDLVPFQINPHYLDDNPTNHGGETREMRINEYIQANQNMTVVGLREGTMLKIENNTTWLIGAKSARIFNYGKETIEINSKDSISNYLNQ